MARFRLAPAAREDLREIVDYVAGASDARTAQRVIRTLKSAMRSLADMPGAGHAREDLTEQDVLFWSVSSYLIVYRRDAYPLEVARVLHGGRDTAAELE